MNTLPPVLVSACLLGETVRHDGGHKQSHHPVLTRWLQEGRVLPLCPELAGGLPVPRAAAEIEPGASGAQVLAGTARVHDITGKDVTAAFVRGAEQARQRVQAQAVCVAVLKAGSPSCGSREVHDGRFQGRRVPGQGVTAALLQQLGVQVFDETQLDDADEALRRLSVAGPR